MSQENELIESQQRYIQLKEKQLEEQQILRMQMQNEQVKFNIGQDSNPLNLIEYQLKLELNKLFHSLSGHERSISANGNEIWIEPTDKRRKILTHYGVSEIMKIAEMYVTPNTLLSDFKLDEVNRILLDFSTTFNDLVFVQQEEFFYHSKPIELYEQVIKIAQEEGIDYDEEELYERCVQWSQEELDSKFSHYSMVCLSLLNLIEATYHRAIDGKERRSLREHTNISQIAQQPLTQTPQKEGFFR